MHPRASARPASSASSRVLPIPGSPWTTSGADRPVAQLAEGAIDRLQFGGAPDEMVGDLGHGEGLRAEHNPAAGSGCEIGVPARCRGARSACSLARMPRYLVHHRHEPHQCGIAFAAFKGHDEPAAPSPGARLVRSTATTRSGGRSRPPSEDDARRQLPFFVAQHSTVTRVTEVLIP